MPFASDKVLWSVPRFRLFTVSCGFCAHGCCFRKGSVEGSANYSWHLSPKWLLLHRVFWRFPPTVLEVYLPVCFWLLNPSCLNYWHVSPIQIQDRNHALQALSMSACKCSRRYHRLHRVHGLCAGDRGCSGHTGSTGFHWVRLTTPVTVVALVTPSRHATPSPPATQGTPCTLVFRLYWLHRLPRLQWLLRLQCLQGLQSSLVYNKRRPGYRNQHNQLGRIIVNQCYPKLTITISIDHSNERCRQGKPA